MRAKAVLPELTQRHEVLVMAGSDAYNALWPDYPVVRTPTFRYHHTPDGRLSNVLTFKRNLAAILDVKWQGPGTGLIIDALKDFNPDVVITDSEAYTHAAARYLRIPRITFDHFGLLVYCRPDLSGFERLALSGNRFVYKTMMGEPERAVVSGFFDVPAIRRGIAVVGPVIRNEVREQTVSRGDYLVCYVTQGQHEFSPQLEQALLSLDVPVRVYGTPRRGMQDNLQFKPIANLPFIEDVAGCRAVIATTGNQLCGEVLYFGKPILGLPMDCLEQRINAIQIERMGVGIRSHRTKINADVIREFLDREEEFRNKAKREFRDGKKEALEAIERFAAELTGRSPQAETASA
jgi:uncharacterized protein (TIGR00661 family)